MAEQHDGEDARAAQHRSSHNNSSASTETATGHAGRFPLELYRMLETVTSMDLNRIVCWEDDGNSFMIQNKPEFERVAMPIFFQRLKYSSFKRLLHLHGFKSVSQRGKDKGAFFHPAFLRDKPELLSTIQKSEKKRPAPKKAPKLSEAGVAAAHEEVMSMLADVRPPTLLKVTISSEEEGEPRKKKAKSKRPSPSTTAPVDLNSRASLHDSPQNAMRLLLAPASHELTETILEQSAGLSHDILNQDGAHVGQAPFVSTALSPSNPQLASTVSAFPPLQQYQYHHHQQELELVNSNIMSLQQQQLLQMELQGQQQQANQGMNVWHHQNTQLESQQLQQLLHANPPPLSNMLQNETSGDGLFLFPAGDAGLNLFNGSLPETMSNDMLEPRPLAPHALHHNSVGPLTNQSLFARHTNDTGESKSNEHFLDRSNHDNQSLQNELLQEWLINNEGQTPAGSSHRK